MSELTVCRERAVAASSPRSRHVVLVGVGHTHAYVVERWRNTPIANASLTCVSDRVVSTYSGLLPAVLAGECAPSAMEIDLPALCARAGARFVVGDVTGVDLGGRRLLVDGQPSIRFDALSVGIGSVPSFDDVEVADPTCLVPIKPMQTLLARLDRQLRAADTAYRHRPLRLVTVGGGAAGVEMALCLPAHVRAVLGSTRAAEYTMVSDVEPVLASGAPRTSRLVERALSRRGVGVVSGRRVRRVGGGLTLDDGSTLDADIALWVTNASPPPLLAALGLPTDGRGFLLTDQSLRSTSGAPIFAVGDAGSLADHPCPKAGVYAVRQGPVLWRNIHLSLSGKPLEPYWPQRSFLRLLHTGKGRAVGEWRGLTFEGRWVWWLKQAIDRGFIAKYQARSTGLHADEPVGPSRTDLR